MPEAGSFAIRVALAAFSRLFCICRAPLLFCVWFALGSWGLKVSNDHFGLAQGAKLLPLRRNMSMPPFGAGVFSMLGAFALAVLQPQKASRRVRLWKMGGEGVSKPCCFQPFQALIFLPPHFRKNWRSFDPKSKHLPPTPTTTIAATTSRTKPAPQQRTHTSITAPPHSVNNNSPENTTSSTIHENRKDAPRTDGAHIE